MRVFYRIWQCVFVAVATLLPMVSAQAYVGPGLGLGTLAVIAGVIGSVFLAIFAIAWYPLKRLFKKNRPSEEPGEQRGVGPSAG